MADFDQFAQDYRDALNRSLRGFGVELDYFTSYKARYIERLIANAAPHKILDYGCGIGVLASMLKKAFPRSTVEGYDVSQASIGRVEKNLLEQGRFTSELANLEGGYDLVVLSNVLHHVVPANREPTLADIVGLMDPSGRLVVFEHNPINPATRFVVSRCEFDEDAILVYPGSVARHFKQVKLRLRRRDYIVFFPRILSLFRALEPMLAWLPLGAQYAMVGEKIA